MGADPGQEGRRGALNPLPVLRSLEEIRLRSLIRHAIHTLRLSRFLVARVLLAEAAILIHFQTIRIVLLILDGVIVALLALAARERNFNALIRCHP